jgi:hypothetical protein
MTLSTSSSLSKGVVSCSASSITTNWHQLVQYFEAEIEESDDQKQGTEADWPLPSSNSDKFACIRVLPQCST